MYTFESHTTQVCIKIFKLNFNLSHSSTWMYSVKVSLYVFYNRQNGKTHIHKREI